MYKIYIDGQKAEKEEKGREWEKTAKFFDINFYSGC